VVLLRRGPGREAHRAIVFLFAFTFEGLPGGGRLAVEGVEIAAGQLVRSADAGEEIAEAAPDFAERYVQIEGERAFAFPRPQLAQRGPGLGQGAYAVLCG
jgi:hypothetical protein